MSTTRMAYLMGLWDRYVAREPSLCNFRHYRGTELSAYVDGFNFTRGQVVQLP